MAADAARERDGGRDAEAILTELYRSEFDALVKVARQDFARAERLAHG